jgi:hypothetical protein
MIEDFQRHSVDIRQFMDFRPSTLPNGMRVVDAYNGSGLTFTVLLDRGMDIWTAHYNGLPLTWISQGSPHPPDFGQSWLRQFNGGLLTTCGLTHVGPPEVDAETGEQRDIHGRYSRLRASEPISVTHEGDRMHLSGVVTQSRLFGEQLRLERTLTIQLGVPALTVSDKITNLGDTPAPLMFLYHCNLGFPLVRAGTKLHTPHHKVYARDESARSGLDTWDTYEAATPGYAEQVFFHHVNHQDGSTMAALLNDDFGLSYTWDARQMPYLTQWKNTRQGVYVCGVEPGNCIPEGRNAARERGHLDMLEPGDSRQFGCTIAVETDHTVVLERIESLRNHGQPSPALNLERFA